MDPFLYALGGAVIGWVVPAVLTKSIATKHVTAKECADCEVRRCIKNLEALVLELAIKAGIPVHSVVEKLNNKGN